MQVGLYPQFCSVTSRGVHAPRTVSFGVASASRDHVRLKHAHSYLSDFTEWVHSWFSPKAAFVYAAKRHQPIDMSSNGAFKGLKAALADPSVSQADVVRAAFSKINTLASHTKQLEKLAFVFKTLLPMATMQRDLQLFVLGQLNQNRHALVPFLASPLGQAIRLPVLQFLLIDANRSEERALWVNQFPAIYPDQKPQSDYAKALILGACDPNTAVSSIAEMHLQAFLKQQMDAQGTDYMKRYHFFHNQLIQWFAMTDLDEQSLPFQGSSLAAVERTVFECIRSVMPGSIDTSLFPQRLKRYYNAHPHGPS